MADHIKSAAILTFGGKDYFLTPALLLDLIPGLAGAARLPESVLADLAAGKESPIVILRRHRGLTQADLAAKIGVTKSFISHIETGSFNAGQDNLLAVADALGVPADLLIRRKSE